jgi:putative transposase
LSVKKALRPGRKRELVDKLRGDWKVSVRRACSTLRIDRALYVYKSKRGDQADLRQRIKGICETRVRYGYRRVHILLRRDGWAVNAKRVYRLYRELSLQLRNKTPKRRVKAKLREDRTEASRINETWAMDFVHDQLATGRKIRVLTSSTPSAASHQQSIRASAIAARMSWKRSSRFARSSASRSMSLSLQSFNKWRRTE